jgi:hypothetical protein
VALADGELEVAGLEKAALPGGKTVLVDAGEDLLGRARDDAALRMQAGRAKKTGKENKNDRKDVAGGLFCGRRMSDSIFAGGETGLMDWPQINKWKTAICSRGCTELSYVHL